MHLYTLAYALEGRAANPVGTLSLPHFPVIFNGISTHARGPRRPFGILQQHFAPPRSCICYTYMQLFSLCVSATRVLSSFCALCIASAPCAVRARDETNRDADFAYYIGTRWAPSATRRGAFFI